MLLLFVSISLQMRILKTTLEACAKKSDIVYMEQLDETRGSKKRRNDEQEKRMVEIIFDWWMASFSQWMLFCAKGELQFMVFLPRLSARLSSIAPRPRSEEFLQHLQQIFVTIFSKRALSILNCCAKHLFAQKRIRKCDEDRTISQIKSEPQPGTKEEKEKPSKVKQQHHH